MDLYCILLVFHVICLAGATGNLSQIISKSMGNPSEPRSGSTESPIKTVSESMRNLIQKPYERKQLGIHQTTLRMISKDSENAIEIH